MQTRWKWFLVLFTAAALMLSSTPLALAQDDPPKDEYVLDEIVVTGSRIERTDIESMSPISVFTETDILESGQMTLEDFVQNMPTITGGYFGRTVNNGNPGYATASMRGLGSNRTLVLLNGQRMPSAGSNGFVDLNMIPVGIVERVEVLRDGASTIYGSDAIAGVVNIITKRDFKGAEFQLQYDITGEGDGEMTQASGIFGASSDRGNVVFGVDYTKREKIMQGDRGFSACPLFENADGSTYCGGSGTSYPGHIFSDTYASHILEGGSVVPFVGADHGFNYAKWSYMVTPQEVLSTYANAHYDLVQESPIGSVTAVGDFVWTNRQSDQLMAAVGTFWGPLVPATNPGNPTGEDAYVARRLFETGGRNFTQDASAWRAVVGLEGELNNGWNWDVTYNYSRWLDARVIHGQINTERVDTAVDPALCAADANCPGVWDPFRTETLTQDLQNYILVTHSPVQSSEMKTLQINLSGDLGELELPGGPVEWAVGYEKREEEALFQPDGGATLGLIYFVSPDKTEGGYSVKELYGEVRVPLLKEQPFADVLAAEISVRSSDYDNLDDTVTNWKGAFEWGPISALRFRTVYAEGLRSPSIGELFNPQQLSAQQYNDPCVNWGSLTNATVKANCQADGLPEDFQLTSNQASSILGGNPNLEPEESESLTVGLVFAPEELLPVLANLSVSVDYFNIKITNAVGTAGTDNIITGCYSSPGFSSHWCSMIPGPTHPFVGDAPHPTSRFRDAIGAVSGVLLTNANLADYETTGVDLAVDYVFEFATSVLNVGVMGTYLEQYDYTPFEGADLVELAGFFGEDQWVGNPATFPEWRVNFNFQYAMGDWSVTWAPRWMGATTDVNADAANGANEADGVWYNDVQATYDYKNWSFAFGVRNLLDEDPPYVTNYDDMNTIQFSYDTAGRYFYGRVSYSF